MYRSISSTLIASLIMLNCYSQNVFAEASFNDKNSHLRSFLNASLLQQKRYIPVDSCLQAACFVKFAISKTGKIIDLKFSKGSPAVMDTVLYRVLKSTEGLWIPAKMGNKNVTSKPFILPLIFSFQAACARLEAQVPGESILNEQLLNLLNFEDSAELSLLDCTVIEPLYTGSVR